MAQSAGSNVNGGRGDTSVRTEQNNINLNASRTSTEVSNVTKVSNSNRSMNLSYADNSQRNGNLRLVADQSLNQSISNRGAVNFNGRSSDYSSGSNTVNGSAFAAFSGILNQGWNTGINSNAASATNIAAQGSTTFSTR
ncbi:hypothetical protein DM480_14415 [Sphingomonas sp. FARSPH]|nr:hypothetical protein DM480_14415 [Sphingomonas sp. FARSPH]